MIDKNNFIIKSSTIILFLLILAIPVLAESGQDLTIAFVPRSLDNPIFLDTFVNSQDKALELDVRLEWVAPFSFDTEGQIEVIENLIRREVNGMIVSVNDVESIHEVISKAIDNGIAVATFDADSPGSERLFHIGIDNTKAGLAIGNALIGVLEKKGLAEQELDIMILTGSRDALNLQERIYGFMQATMDEVNLNITDILENHDDLKLAINLVEGYVKEHPDIDIIYFVGGWPFYVPAEAMPNFQKWAQNGGTAVGIDIFYNALVLQEEGLIDYLIGQDFASMGSVGLEHMVNYIRYGSRPPVFIETGLEHANNENIKELLEIHKPWSVK
ncbi:MAG: substrate-binding domain-containing protein [Halanaerobiales bacterium]